MRYGVQWIGFAHMAMLHKRIAIVAAMRSELVPLLKAANKCQRGRVELYELDSAVVAIGGVGQAAGRRAAEVAIDFAQPDVLISAGFGGALRPELHVGDVVMAREVVDADNGKRYPTLGGEAVVVTSANIVGPAEKRRLREQYSAVLVDMEGAAVAAVAAEHGLEFMAVKAVSDEIDFPMPPLGRFVDADGKMNVAKLLMGAALHPQWWLPLAQLGRNSAVASVHLTRRLEHLIEQYSTNILKEKVSLR